MSHYLDKELDSWTREVLENRHSATSRRRILEKMQVMLYQYPVRFSKWEPEQASALYEAFHAKLPGVLDRFEYKGYSFGTYCKSIINWQMKSHLRQLKEQENRQETLLEQVAEDSKDYSEDPDLHRFQEKPGGVGICHPEKLWEIMTSAFFPGKKGTLGLRPQKRLCKYLLILSLKYLSHFGESQMEKLSAITQVSLDQLWQWQEYVKDEMKGRWERKREMEKQASEIWAEICFYNRFLKVDMPEQKKGVLEKRLARFRDRHSRLVKALRRFHILTKHSTIAHLLDLPKGTVDSILYKIGLRHGFPGKG